MLTKELKMVFVSCATLAKAHPVKVMLMLLSISQQPSTAPLFSSGNIYTAYHLYCFTQLSH